MVAGNLKMECFKMFPNKKGQADPSVNSRKCQYFHRNYVWSPAEGTGGGRGSSLSGTGPIRAGHRSIS